MLPILTNMSFRVSRSLRDQFSQTAQQNDRNASQLLRDYMRVYIDQHRGTSFDKSMNVDLALGSSLEAATAAQPEDPVQSAAAQQEIAAAKEQAIRTERLQYRLKQCLRKRYSDFY